MPPSIVSSNPIEKFLANCAHTLGPGAVITSQPEVARLSKDPSPRSRTPRGYLYPSSLAEIQEILRAANEFGVPLWVYSTGKNWGYLNTSNSENSVVVILSRMNRILHVDRNLAYAEIEPGVTYEQLNHYLKENGYDLWTDSPGGPPSGSVIGNALDRGVGVTPYGDHYAHLCGMEVLLPDGTVLHTGSVVDPERKSAQHCYKWGVGPIWEGIFTQSNFGVVTRAGIWLMRTPKDYSLLSVKIESDKKLAACMDEVRELMLRGILPPIGRFSNDVAMLTLLTQACCEDLEGGECLSTGDLERLKKKYSVPTWQASCAIYGDSKIVHLKARRATSALSLHGRVKALSKSTAALIRRCVCYVERRSSPLITQIADWASRAIFNTSFSLLKLLPALIELHEGSPIEVVVRRGYFRAKKPRPEREIDVARDGVGILWFVPVLPFKGDEVTRYIALCREQFASAKVDFYMTVMIFNERSVCPLMALLFDREDSADCKKAQQLYDALMLQSQELGYQQFRCGASGWDTLFSRYPELRRLNERIKETLDPNYILAPGRYGIGAVRSPKEIRQGSSTCTDQPHN